VIVLKEKAIKLTEASTYRRKRLLKEKKSGVMVRKNKGIRKAVRGRMNFRVWVATLSRVCLICFYNRELRGKSQGVIM